MHSFITETITGNKQVQMLMASVLITKERITDQRFKNILRLWGVGEAEPLQRGSACWILNVILLVYFLICLYFNKRTDIFFCLIR